MEGMTGGSRRWVRATSIASLAALAALAASRPATAVTYEPEPPFCRGVVVRDYAAPLEKMPKLRAPGREGRLGFFKGRNVALTRIERFPPRLPADGKVGYHLRLLRRGPSAHPQWSVTTALARVNRRGRAVAEIARSARRVRSISWRERVPLELPVPRRPAFYRLTTAFHSLAGRRIGAYGFYFRVARPVQKARLALNAPAYRSGQTVFARVENYGTVTTVYGVPYAIQRLEGNAWVTAPQSPRGPWILPLLHSPPGRSGDCNGFWIPPTMLPGRYRMAKDVEFLAPRQKAQKHTLTAEFDVLP